jgi:hypothetical protein
VLPGGDFDGPFQAADLGVQRAEQVEAGLDPAPGVRVGDAGRGPVPFGLVLDVAADGVEVQLAPHGVDVSVEFGPLTDQSQSGAQQVAEPAALTRVGVGQWEVAPAQESSEDLGVVGVGLGLGFVEGLDPPGVPEFEPQSLVAAGVGQPVPGVDALAADQHVGSERCEYFQEGLGLGLELA